MITCKICGQKFHTISPAHLKKHWTTMVAYKILYPSAPLRSEETKTAISKALKGKAKSESHRNKLAEGNRQRAKDPEWIKVVTKAQRKRREREREESDNAM